MQRDDKDYAIEFGEYLAKAAEAYMKAANDHCSEDRCSNVDAQAEAHQIMSEAWSGLRSAVYEFRKRAARAGHEPSAVEFAK